MESASKITYIRYFYENLNNSSLFISKKLFMFAGHIAHSNPYCEGAISRFQAALSRHIAIQGSRSRRYCLRSANSKSHSRRVTNFETLPKIISAQAHERHSSSKKRSRNQGCKFASDFRFKRKATRSEAKFSLSLRFRLGFLKFFRFRFAFA